MSKYVAIIAWLISAFIIVALGITIINSSTTTMRVNGEPINLIFGSVCIIIAVWFGSIAYGVHREAVKYTIVSSSVIAIIWGVLIVGQILLLLNGDLIVYKYLYMYGSGLLLAIYTVVSSIIVYRRELHA